MIIFDTETTGLVMPSDVPLNSQPKIIELYALKVDDDTLEPITSIDLLIDPQEQVTDEITRITGITNDMVRGKGSFASHFKSIQSFWFGDRVTVGHNVNFDKDMLELDLRRLGKVTTFPWPLGWLCTVELTEHYKGRRMKLIDLHEYLFGERFDSAHRAKSDVEATHRCLVEIKKRGDLPELQ